MKRLLNMPNNKQNDCIFLSSMFWKSNDNATAFELSNNKHPHNLLLPQFHPEGINF
jgi:hypothetical protein